MLIRFEVANFRSILDPVELSMVAVDREREAARAVPSIGESLLPVAAIYGPNASGKSNLLAALAWLQAAVRDSLLAWDEVIPVEPFAFARGEDRPSEFTVEWIVDGVRFEYVLELDRRSVRYEGLFHYPEKKRRRIFEREHERLVLQRGLGNLSGTRELLTPRSLVLSIARRFDEPLISGFVQPLLASRTRAASRFGPSGYGSSFWPDGRTSRWFDEDSPDTDRRQALGLLRLADLGVEDVVVDRDVAARLQSSFAAVEEAVADRLLGIGADAGLGRARQRRRERLVHRTASGPVPLDFDQESHGTQVWYRLIGPVLDTLRSGTLLLFDEIDASLHPALSAELLRLFHDPATNPRGAQLIFTSHDTSLLNHLNRDEVWLTDRSEDGVTRLGSLAEFAGERVRKSQNIERAYLHGRYGALPEVDRSELLRGLGLIG